MRSTKTTEAGFTLIETLVVVAVVAMVGLGAAGAVAMIGKNGEPQTNRNLALMVARNALERARVAAAYLPIATDASAGASVSAYAQTGDATYVLQPGTTSFTAQVSVPAITCGTGTATTIAVGITTVVTPPAPGTNGTSVAVTATYPPSACAPSQTASVMLGETLAPPALAPGTRVYAPLSGEPADQ
jgi:prepilin-type N-terminal cleavage/methylation domain-containing protein